MNLLVALAGPASNIYVYKNSIENDEALPFSVNHSKHRNGFLEDLPDEAATSVHLLHVKSSSSV